MAYTIFFDNSKIDNYPLPQLKKHMGWDANILNLCLDKNDVMWVNQDRYGLCLYDLSQDLFADNSGNNLSNPGVVTIKKLCDGLEITLGEFFSTPEFDTLEQEIK